MTYSMKVKTSELFIETIGYCNLSCKYCYTKRTRDILPAAKIIAFAERYIDYVNLPRIRITFIGRGETTLHPDLPDIINYLSDKYGNKVSFYIQTNGILIRQVIDQLKRKDNLEISISLDGFESANDANRGVGTYQKIVQNIKYLANLGIPLNVQTILCPENYPDAKRFQDFIQSISNHIRMEFFDILTYEEVQTYENQTHILPLISANDPEIIEMRRALTSSDFDFVREAMTSQDVYICILCDGRVSICCEFQYRIGTIDTDIAKLVSKLDLKLCGTCPLRTRCNSGREQDQVCVVCVDEMVKREANV
ncbi:MAG: putative Fe-S oxidoreductase [Promethearchaeota archaeon CR_4]|nr:MAG: putative Fe-S oxidoreductase [Candidatus Lokiarchaeota archaeon CR_4]